MDKNVALFLGDWYYDVVKLSHKQLAFRPNGLYVFEACFLPMSGKKGIKSMQTKLTHIVNSVLPEFRRAANAAVFGNMHFWVLLFRALGSGFQDLSVELSMSLSSVSLSVSRLSTSLSPKSRALGTKAGIASADTHCPKKTKSLSFSRNWM